MKKCHKCHQLKDLSEFNKNKTRKDGLQARCRICDKVLGLISYKKYRKKAIAREKLKKRALKDWIIEFKKSQKCSKCGDNRWYVLDFHHTRDKKDSVSKMVANGATKKKIMEEIEKCIVLCSNCHREEHYFASLAEID